MGLLKRMFDHSPDVPAQESVAVGDRFFQVGMGNCVWTVVRICARGQTRMDHAVIERTGSFPDSKILSVNTLLNPSLYRPDRRGGSDGPPPAGVEGRRKSDPVRLPRVMDS